MPSACFDAIGNVSTQLKHAFGESTEKVEKRVFRAVGNGYKPPQNLYYIHYVFLVLSFLCIRDKLLIFNMV